MNPIAPPPSPPPTNASLTNLQYSQTFASDSASSTAQFDLTSKTAVSGATALSNVTVAYDATSQSYTIEAPGRTQTFGPGDVQSSSDNNQTEYQKQQGSGRDYLTLVKVPYTSSTQLQYVALGYWQRNDVVGTTQNTTFDIFSYGIPTPATAVPRTGVANYGIDAFGFLTIPGLSPKTVQGHGNFTADFLTGAFSASTDLEEIDLISGAETIGALTLDGGGHLSSTDGTFSGDITYQAPDANVAGKMTGRFYGPAAQELGGSFAADNAGGSTLTGAFTGSLDPNVAPSNVALTNLVANQYFYAQSAFLDTMPGAPLTGTYQTISGLDINTDGTIVFSPGLSNQPVATFTAADKVTSSPDRTTYRKTVDGQTVELDLFTPGSSNTQIDLTYASFGTWFTNDKPGAGGENHEIYFVYGIETPQGLLARRTGMAHYDGILMGAGADRNATVLYDLSGKSHFDVDFGAQSISGSLAITGKDRATAASVNFGSFAFNGSMGYLKDTQSTIMEGTNIAGSVTTRFYGPGGEEIGGSFQIAHANSNGSTTYLTGATIAKIH